MLPKVDLCPDSGVNCRCRGLASIGTGGSKGQEAAKILENMGRSLGMLIEGVPDRLMPAGCDWLVVASDIGPAVAFVRESAMGWATLVPAARIARVARDERVAKGHRLAALPPTG